MYRPRISPSSKTVWIRIVDARTMIVEGAVGMVEMALERLNEKELVELDEERRS